MATDSSAAGNARVIGTAGGMVKDASGAAVIVPAGAAQADTTIRIAMDSTGAPALPSGLVAAGNTFAITPHGSQFVQPVEVRIPASAAGLQPNQQLQLATAEPGGAWELLDSTLQDGMLSAKVSGFSYFVGVIVSYPLPVVQALRWDLVEVSVSCPGALDCTHLVGNASVTVSWVSNGGQFPTCATGAPRMEVRIGRNFPLNAPPLAVGPISSASVTVSALPVPGSYATLRLTATCGTPDGSWRYRYDRGLGWSIPAYPALEILRMPAQLDVVSGLSAGIDAVLAGGAAKGRANVEDFAVPTKLDRAVIDWERSDDNGASWRPIARSFQNEADPHPIESDVDWRYWGVRHGFIAAASDQGALMRLIACYTPPDVAAPPCVTSRSTLLNVLQQSALPSIVDAPRPVLVKTGQTASFSATVQGAPAPTLRWQTRAANATGAWSDVSTGSGAGTGNLTTPILSTADNGTQFRVVASNSVGTAESAAVTVSVSDLDVAPTITSQPVNLSVASNSDAAFAIAARGTEALSYQWRLNGTPILGANSPVLRLPAVAAPQAGNYTVTVTNAAGTATSNSATLTVGAAAPGVTAPTIVTQPVSVLINAGNTATFAVGASGSAPIAYQWSRNGQPIAGATAAFYSIAAAALGDAATYRVQVSNGVGPAVLSDNVILTVNASPLAAPVALTTQPSPQVQAPGGTATFAVAVTGSGPIAYQWLKNGAPIPGATSAVLSFASVAGGDAASYAVTVSNAMNTITSNVAGLVVLGAPAITAQPAATSAAEGATATFSVTASGSLLGYQWTRNGLAIPGASGSSYTTPTLALVDSGAVYGVVVYNGAGVAFSGSAVLTVTPKVAPSATSKFAYVAANDGSLTAYTINAVTGGLSVVGSFNVGPSLRAVAVDPSGKFAYATKNTGQVFAFTINGTTGALTAVAGSPYASGSFAIAVAVEPTGRFVYVANYDSNDVSVFSINATTGALTAVGAPVASGSKPDSITIHPSGKFAYVTNSVSANVSAYTIDATTGALTAVAGSPFAAGTDPNGVSVEPSGRFAYVANRGSNDVSVFAINASTGGLTAVGAAVPAGTNPQSITVDPSGKFAYVANKGSADVSAYTINGTTGVLTAVGLAVPAGTDAYSVTVDASGKFAYVANFSANNVSAYAINTSTGALTALTNSPFAAGSQPISITTSGVSR